MPLIALAVVVLIVLIIVLNPKRWRRLSDSARGIKKQVRAGTEDDGQG